MPASLEKQMLGGDGVMRLITSGTTLPVASGYLFDYLVVNTTNTQVSGLYDVNSDSLNLADSGQYNLSGNNLSAGIIIIGKNGARITGVSVVQGSVIGYQSRDKGNLRL